MTPRDEQTSWEGEMYRLLVENVQDYAIFIIDTERRVLSWSRGAERVLGYSEEEILGQSADRIFTPEDIEQGEPEREVTAALKTGRGEDDRWHVHKSGTRFWCSGVVTPLWNEQGKLRGFAKIMRDLTDRKRQQEALQKSEELHRVIANLTSDYAVTCQILPDGQIQVESVTAGFQKVTGYTLDEMEQGDGWGALVDREGVSSIMDSIRRWLAGEEHTSRVQIRTRSGKLRWLEYLGQVVRDPAFQTTRLYMAAQDITERKHAQEQLRQQRKWLQVTLASIGDAVAATDIQGQVTFLNPVAESLTGWSQADAQGLPLSEVFQIVNEYTREVVENPVSKVLRLGQIVGLANHTILIARDGTERPIDDSAAPIRDAQGKIIGVVLVFRDVTEKRTAENALHRRTEELTDADRRKNEFLAMLAHELRNPLAPIRSGLDLLTLEFGVGETIRLMQDQVDHLVRLVDDLLDVSRIVRGRIELRRESVQLAPIVGRAVQTVESFVEQRNHQLTVSLPDEPVWLDADPVRLAQVLTNLLNNSAKYTDPGGHITLSAEITDDGLTIRVRDTGMGIEADLLPHVFDLFTQAERSIDRAQGGLGLGLTLVRTLVEMHDGTVTAQSAGPGHGSEFTIRLPRLHNGRKPARRPLEEINIPPRRILVVDDNVGAAKMLRLLLAQIGASDVYTAYDGPAALAAAQEHRPEIILLDIGLPRMNGYEVARRLREAPEFRNTLLVAVTGYGQEEDIQASQAAGFDEHLVKPPAVEALLQLFTHPKLSK